MFKTRRIIRIILIYFILFFLLTFWYLSKLESTNEIKSFSTHRLAVIVPYRNRSNELELFIPHMNSFLNSQSIEHIFIIVNQVDRHRFNRAALINIGFIESRLIADYIVMHDIDLLPLNIRELYHPIYHYPTYVGGILIIASKDFERINGMSPLYWGWGREDDNFYVRMTLAGMIIQRPSNLSTNYNNTFQHIHDRGVHKRDYAKYGKQKEEGRKIHREMGWNTTKYKIMNKEMKKTNEGIEYLMFDVEIYCDYHLTSWCDHPTNISSK